MHEPSVSATDAKNRSHNRSAPSTERHTMTRRIVLLAASALTALLIGATTCDATVTRNIIKFPCTPSQCCNPGQPCPIN